jgi:tRNA-specific 2-thiouridylase
MGITAGNRLFVSAIRPETNEVVLSDGADLYTQRAYCTDLNWIGIKPPASCVDCTVRLRYSKIETPATLIPVESGMEILLHKPARAPTPGQLAVFYDDDLILGSGWITAKD